MIAPDIKIKESPTTTMLFGRSERLTMAELSGHAGRNDSCDIKPTTAITTKGMDAIKSPLAGSAILDIELSPTPPAISIREKNAK